MIQFANYISTTLTANITTVQLTIPVQDTTGMPAVTTASGNYFYLTLVDQQSAVNNTNPPVQREVVKVTDITGLTLTVTRAQDNTVAQAFALGSVAEIRFNAQAANELRALWSNVLAPCNIYQESGETAQYTYNQFRVTDPGTHPGVVRAALTVEYRPVGSGTNGPASDDIGFQVSNIKHQYPAVNGIDGEIDGINIVTRNQLGDTAGLVANVQVASGFGCFAEAITTEVPPGGGPVTRTINAQIATIDTPSNQAFGFIVQVPTGAGSDGVRVQSTTPGAWTNFFHAVVDGTSKMWIAADGSYAINSLPRLAHTGAANFYTSLYDGSGVEAERLGGSGDPVNYYGNTAHAWYTRTFATKIAQLDATGWSLQNGIRLDQVSAANGAIWTRGIATELIVLNTGGLTTDSVADLLPANSIIEAVVGRVTTTITATTDWAIGDPTTSARFASANATLVAGTTFVGLNQFSGAVSTLAAGPTQAAAAKVRITCTGANPGAGAIRITVFYRTFTPPTS